MALFSLIARLGLDGTNFETGILRAQGAGQKFAGFLKREVGGAIGGAFTATAILGFAKHVTEVGDRIGDLAEQLGITTDQVQTLQALAGQTGVKFETMAKALDVVNGKRLEAIETDGEARKSFASLGISVNELNKGSLDNVSLLERMGQSHLKAGRNAGSQAALVDLLGIKAFHAADAIAKIQELGPIKLITPQDLKDLGQLADTLDQIQRDVVVSAAPEIGFWGRAAKRAAADDATNKGGFMGVLKTLGLKGSIVKAGFQEMFADQSQLNETFPAEPLAPKEYGKKDSKNKAAKALTDSNGSTHPMTYNIGQSSDPYSKIGIFTQFGAQQDRVITELRDQKRELAYIRKASETTAKAVTQ
jgi:hypothetical protein